MKVGAFQSEFVGKMQFYLTVLDRQVRQEDENPSVGIILSKEKNRTVVEYALHDARKPIGVATYRNYPDPAQVAERSIAVTEGHRLFAEGPMMPTDTSE